MQLSDWITYVHQSAYGLIVATITHPQIVPQKWICDDLRVTSWSSRQNSAGEPAPLNTAKENQ